MENGFWKLIVLSYDLLLLHWFEMSAERQLLFLKCLETEVVLCKEQCINTHEDTEQGR